MIEAGKTYMIEAGKTYRLRGGLTARIGFTDKKGPRPISGLIDRGETEEHQTWHLDGRALDGTTRSHSDIIMPEPERKSHWLNWYGEAYGSEGNFENREYADAHALSHRINVVEIITEDGKPVDVKIHKVER